MKPCPNPSCAKPTMVTVEERRKPPRWRCWCISCDVAGPEGLSHSDAVKKWDAMPRVNGGEPLRHEEALRCVEMLANGLDGWLAWFRRDGARSERIGAVENGESMLRAAKIVLGEKSA